MDLNRCESWIVHRGVEVMVHDYRDVDHSELAAEILKNSESSVKRGSGILLLVNVSGVRIDKDAMAAFKEVSVKSKPYFKKVAVLGVEGLKRILMDRVVFVARLTNTQEFDTEREALDWLTREDYRL